MMYPLLVTSAAALALIVVAPLLLRMRRVFPRGVQEQWRPCFAQPASRPAERLPRPDSLGAVMLLRILQAAPRTRRELKEVAEDELAKLRFKLEWPLAALESIANVSPLLGLTGTVIGIIKIFSNQTPGAISSIGLSSGISEALLTTLVGLVTAVPCLLASGAGHRALDSLLLKAEVLLLETAARPASGGEAEDCGKAGDAHPPAQSS